jgi:uncharacterized protein
MNLVNEKRLKDLFTAGLDEIRFHPNLDDPQDWNKINLALKYSWKIGVEIPAIPGYEDKTKKLIDFLEGKISFLNLNELEFSDTNAQHYKLDKMNFKQRDHVSYGVRGSEELALKLLEYGKNKKYSIHYCTSKLKNKVQMGNRLKIRAKNSAMKFDRVTPDGFLLRGALFLKGFEPGFDYQKRLGGRKKEVIIALGNVAKLLAKKLKLSEKDFFIDVPRMRVLTSVRITEKYATQIKSHRLLPAIVKEYPTSDFFTLELDFL